MKSKLRQIFSGDTKVELTEGGIGKPLLYLSLPVVISNLLQVAYNIVDVFWLGRVSTEALAAVGFVFPVIFFLVSLGIGLSIAGSIFVAQNQGKSDSVATEKAASQTLLYISIFSVLIGITGYFLSEQVITLLGAEEDVIPLATDYLQIVSLGMILYFGFSVFNSLMRGYGDTVTPMLIMGGSVMLNMVLDPLLIFGWSFFPELGVEGAALATIISRGLGFAVGLYILFSGVKGLKVSLSQMWPDLGYLKRTVFLGAPASLEIVTRSLSVNAILIIVGMFSTPVVAAYGIVIRIYSAVYLPAIAVSRSVETMTAQNHGAGKVGRAEKANAVASKYILGILSVLGLFCIIFASPVLSLFSSDPEVIAIGSEFLRILGLSFGFVGVKSIYNGGLRGIERTFTSAMVAVVTLWVIRIPFAYLSVDFMGETGIWWAFTVSNILGAVIGYLVFKKMIGREY